ncbi:hypothetical protein RKD38_007635 [Streptomyces ambofaciens]
MGSAGAALAGESWAGWTLAMPPSGSQRDSVPAADRPPLAGPSSLIRQLEDGPRPSSQVVGGRHVGENPAGPPDRGRCRGPDRLEHGQRRFHDLPRSSARGRCLHPRPEIPGRRRSPERHRPDEALGRSRGGLTSKIHLAGGGGCRPLGFVITPGQWRDAPQMIAVLEEIRVPRQAGGRPRTRPDHVGGDKAYSSRRNQRHLRRRQIKHTIPEPRDQRANRRYQPTQDLPSHRHALRQTDVRLPRNGHRSGDPLMAASGMKYPPRYPGSGGEVR